MSLREPCIRQSSRMPIPEPRSTMVLPKNGGCVQLFPQRTSVTWAQVATVVTLTATALKVRLSDSVQIKNHSFLPHENVGWDFFVNGGMLNVRKYFRIFNKNNHNKTEYGIKQHFNHYRRSNGGQCHEENALSVSRQLQEF